MVMVKVCLFSSCNTSQAAGLSTVLQWTIALLLQAEAIAAWGFNQNLVRELRRETVDAFYHGYQNYMDHAFPEDELRPLSCAPLSRVNNDPARIDVNDVLGNYSLTLIDSLSTLAIIASTSEEDLEQFSPLEDFQNGIVSLVKLYGDGKDGKSVSGSRARGFDIDSKVQVFETVIRGLGGLLSAHQFAIGDLPIQGYTAEFERGNGTEGVRFMNGYLYDGQLLRLAYDLGERLLPAFDSPTGLPYPRVNLRSGIPFYLRCKGNPVSEDDQCHAADSEEPEVTETCSAGAGSLILEMTLLSRLTGDERFETVAKRAFWSVWDRRSSTGLIGSGIDAETGHWVTPYTGIGAGIDSFFEYAFKQYIFVSGSDEDVGKDERNSASSFLHVWQSAHEGILRHIYRGATYQHPHYLQVDLYSGATRAYWIDSLSAYFPGLLTLAGEIEEAMSTHLLFAALWTRYSALPERWSVASGNVEGGLRWWGGRPEFIESTWYLYRATKDPWYIHVGEMTLKDIKRRCRVPCGWAGLHDVRTGEQTDRMESFFLGETIKYLFLLFTPQHPLNHWDAPFVFTTEGHPVIIPRRLRGNQGAKAGTGEVASQPPAKGFRCALPPSPLPLTVSTVAARKDLFHAASLARLHLVPTHNLATAASIEMTYDHPSMSVVDEQSPLNHSFYPWTLSNQLVPPDGISAIIATRSTFDLSFPTLPNTVGGPGTMSRVNNGVVLGSVSGLSLGLVRETIQADDRIGQPAMEHYRIFSVSNMEIGNDDTVYMSRKLIENFNPADPYFTRIKEWQSVHVIAEIGESQPALVKKLQAQIRGTISPDADAAANENDKLGSRNKTLVALPSSEAETLLDVLKRLIEGNAWSHERRRSIYAVTAVGVGSAPLPEVGDSSEDGDDRLPWTSIYFSDETCGPRLPFLVPREYQVIVMKRGGCSFTEKLEKIPAFPPSEGGLKLVIIVSYPHQEGEQDFAPAGGTGRPIRPLLEDIQHTMTGIPRHHPIPLILVSGGDQTYEYLKNSQAIGLRRSWNYYSQGLKIQNLLMV